MTSFRRLLLVLGLLGAPLVLAGCPDDTTPSTAADAGVSADAAASLDASTEVDASSAADAASVVDAATNACTDLVNGGEFVPETAGFVFFGASGGTVADGTYYLTQFKIFSPGSVDEYLRKHTLRFDGDGIEVVIQRDAEPAVAMSGTWTASGSTLTVNIDCPAAMVFTMEYTASETHFTEIVDDDDSREIHTYEKQ